MARETRESCEKRSSLLIRLFATFAYFAGLFSAVAEEPFFKKGDVIAIVGGEDMVAMSEYGYLELLLTRALPKHRLKFRNLAWEGDTVFEQRRDLNFPPLEAQLDQVGATVVLCQFGQMESLAGKEKLPEFVAAYEKLLARMSGGGKRRIALLLPNNPDYEHFGDRRWKMPHADMSYWDAIAKLADRLGDRTLPGCGSLNPSSVWTRDGYHHIAYSQAFYAPLQMGELGFSVLEMLTRLFGGENNDEHVETLPQSDNEHLRQLIVTKNRLWFDYWRVQNWAFLAGDRTEQPSSRDHLDRTKRWFPAEREQFLPLIEKKEQAIWDLAAKLASPAAASK